MTTQLRLVDPPPPVARPAKTTRATKRATAAEPANAASTRTTRARVAPSGRQRTTSGRRAVRWGEWQLDDSTRRIGREGVAAAREALERAVTHDDLRHAS
ncbi:MAG: hypothetical protein ABW211_01815 [Acidimicrobiia bacterium]